MTQINKLLNKGLAFIFLLTVGVSVSFADSSSQTDLKNIDFQSIDLFVSSKTNYDFYTTQEHDNTYNIYYGNLHSHTSYSDGAPGSKPADALRYARDVANLDFLAVTDHAILLNAFEWADLKKQAQLFTIDGEFVAIHGFEWTTLTKGHINVLNSSEYKNFIELRSDFTMFYNWLCNQGEAYAFFNHPDRDSEGNFNNLKFFNQATDDRMIGIEIHLSEYFDDYIKALQQGWHVGALANQDNHDWDWGTKNNYRTAVLARNLTKSDILDAVASRRYYATIDTNAQMYFSVNDYPMGSIIKAKQVDLRVTLYDPDIENFVRVDLYDKSGTVIDSQIINESFVQVTFSQSRLENPNYFFVKVIQEDGNFIYSSPIWTLPRNSPDSPIISGPIEGKIGQPYEYTFITNDPEGDNVYYWIEWGDGNIEQDDWIGSYPSGEPITLNYIWNATGTYNVMAKAKDIYGSESDWGNLQVSMPKTHNNPFIEFLERLFKLMFGFVP